MNTPPSRCSRQAPAQQTGVVLLLCLLFLTALTLLGLSASAETVMQDTLANNLQETQRARQSALAAQVWVERWLLGLEGTAPASCTQPCEGLFIHAAGSLPAQPGSQSRAWWLVNGHEAGVDPITGEQLATLSLDSIDPPLWLIEQLHEVAAVESGAAHDQAWYRIIARGSGRTQAGIAVIESIVTRPWPVAGTESQAALVPTGFCPGLDPAAPCQRIAWRILR
jgi:Tfp pilus assembly protein PilX